ncbi:MAG: metallophosphoesterase, partial [Bacteroidales bacterium]|nr:metallophosphoesterase [Bacteroidales bacterium]
KRVDLTFDNLSVEFEGYRIAQISDLHVGSYGENPGFLKKVVQCVNAEQTDLIVFTGDIINLNADEIKPFKSVLSGLHAKDGVMAVLGNHDYSLYGMRKRPTNLREMVGQVVQAERQMGWDVLLNEHRIIARSGAQMAVIGVEDIGKPPFPKLGDLQAAMAGLSDTTFKILLSHDPSHWRMEVLPETDIPLMLAGHTHAAQFKIGSWAPVRWMYKEWSGEYVEGKQRLYVSEGVGGSLPFRFGATPEIVVFTLHTSFSK